MKVENLKCRSITPTDGDKLVIVLFDTTFTEVKKLIGKEVLTVYTDNEENPQVTEEHYDYAKGESIKYDLDDETYTLTLRKLSTLEKEVQELRELVTAESNKTTV